jgi:hypothetical protein
MRPVRFSGGDSGHDRLIDTGRGGGLDGAETGEQLLSLVEQALLLPAGGADTQVIVDNRLLCRSEGEIGQHGQVEADDFADVRAALTGDR